MQANKDHLIQIARYLGVELRPSLDTAAMLDAISAELRKLHVSIVRLCPGAPRDGEACAERMVMFHALAGKWAAR